MDRRQGPGRLLWLVLAILAAGPAAAAEPDEDTPLVSIIIDDLGWRMDQGLQAIALPGPLAYAVLPHTPNGPRLAQIARAYGREVLLHLPMEAEAGEIWPGPGTLSARMERSEFLDTLTDNLAAVPLAVGVNNHMGSLLTRQPAAMGWLMEALRDHGDLFFVDSRTTAHSIAAETALAWRIPLLVRDVFLDHRQDEHFVRGQMMLLVERARARGAALGIGHPYPETMAVLAAMLPELAAMGVRLVSLAELLRHQQQRSSPWQEPSSPSLTDARNWKPSP